MFLVPLFFTSFINIASYFSEMTLGLNIITHGVAIMLFLATCYVCKNSLNLTHTYNWKYDADTKNMLHDLSVIRKSGDKNLVKLGITWWFEPTINFYIQTGKIHGLIGVRGDGRNEKYDFFYIDKSENSYFDQSETKLIQKYSLSEATLYITK